MSVQYANRVERIRRPGAAPVEVPGGDPDLGLSALALATTRPLTGAARSAVRAGAITPTVAASVVFESTATMPLSGPDRVQVYQRGVVPPAFVPRTPYVGLGEFGNGRRQNAPWVPFLLDESPTDDVHAASPDVTGAGWLEADGLTVLDAGTELLPLVRNPAAAFDGEDWSATSGTYSIGISNVLPALGFPGERLCHRVTSAPLAAASLVSPWAHARYRVTPGRPFTVAAWLSSNVDVNTYRYRLDLQEHAAPGRVLSLYSSAFTVPTTGRRVAATLTVPAGPTGAFTAGVTGDIRFYRGRVAVERVTAATAPSRPSVVTLNVRGAHAYAGGDRGDTEGLKARPVYGAAATDDLLVGVRVPPDQRFLFNRVDVHGSDVYGHPTAATVWRVDGRYAHAASTGRLTVRFPTLGDNQRADDPTDSLVTVYVEEVNTGGGTDVYLQAVELAHEEDLTDRIVGVTVDRTTDADPADSTVPIGNYAATTCSLQLDNADRALSPFRASYIDLGHPLEVAAGVVYTNRHDDPFGEGLTTPGFPAPWVGELVEVAPDVNGTVPPGARRMVVAQAGGVAVQGPGAEGWRVRVGVWARARDEVDANLRIGYRAGTFVVPFAGHVLRAGTGWQYREVLGTIPTGAAMTAIGADTGVCLAAPTIERLDPTTGDVIEVRETAGLGLFATTDWPTATDADTFTVNAVDVLAARGGLPLTDEPVRVGMTAGALLRHLFRVYLDRGADQVVVADDTPVVPYAIPAADVATMVADVAKAAALTAHTDGQGRPIAVRRDDVEPTVAVEYREDNALVRAAVPFTPSLVRNDVTVTGWTVSATPAGTQLATLGNAEPTEFDGVKPWEPSGREVRVPAGGGRVSFTVPYPDHAGALSAVAGATVVYAASDVGALSPVNLASRTVVPPPSAGASWSRTDRAVSVLVEQRARDAVVTVVVNPLSAPVGGVPSVYAPEVIVDHIRVDGVGLVEAEVREHREAPASIATYGRRPVEVRTRLGATVEQLQHVAADVLDNYALKDDTGERWLPDLEATTLGDPWRELGDRILAREPRTGIGGEYRVVSHVLDVGSSMRSRFYLRRVTTGATYFVADVSLADGDDVLTY